MQPLSKLSKDDLIACDQWSIVIGVCCFVTLLYSTMLTARSGWLWPGLVLIGLSALGAVIARVRFNQVQREIERRITVSGICSLVDGIHPELKNPDCH